ncbi:beta strand repeat-containing protein [Piscirickettsia litoralis]|uniref:S-layer family protein n=1 Tax=Piscirickettsia litoralis TaxID=1891921 RepID=A0ABX3A0H4_9GAMM|nr:hypothetical protein [Piscirickettsia litoralis]ODN42347.1 hypothetical protein BGC07_04620 [Piscirickettsia litoralis]
MTGSAINANNNITANQMTFTGPVATAAGTFTYNSNGNNMGFSNNLTGGSTNLTLNAGAGTLTLGGVTTLNSLSITSNANNIANNITTTIGGIIFTNPVTLTGNSVFTSTGNPINLDTVDGTQAFTIDAGASTVALNDKLGDSTRLGNFAVTGAGGITINTDTIKAAQIDLNNPVTLTAGVTLDSNSNPINFENTVNGTQALTINAGASTATIKNQLGNTARIGTLGITGNSIVINNNITANQMTFTGPVVTAAGTFTYDSNSNNIGFTNTLTGADTNLILNAGAGGDVTFANAVSLESLNTSANLANVGNNITTDSGGITFSSPVTLTGNSTFNSTNSAIVLDAVDGTKTFTLNAGTSTVALNNPIGASTRLGALDITGSAGITINTASIKAAQMDMNSPVTLAATTTLDSNGNAINLDDAVNATAAGMQGLTLSGGAGAVTLTGALGNVTRLGALSVTGSAINANNNITANQMTFTGPVATAAGTFTYDSNSNNIDFANTLTGVDTNLILNAGAGGDVTFANAVSLESLNTSANLANVGNNITTDSGGITFSSPIVLTGSSVFDSNSNTLTLNNTVDATTANVESLTLTATGGAVTIAGAVGAGTKLNTLTVNSSTLNLQNTLNATTESTTASTINVSGSGSILEADSLTTANDTINITAGTYNENIDFSNNSLTVITNGGTVNVDKLTISNPLTLAGTITSTNDIDVNEAVTLSAATILTGANINITNANAKFDGNQDLTLSSTGTIDIQQALGAGTALGAFTSSGSGSTQLGANISAQGGTITFNTPVVLTADTTHTDSGATGIQFNDTVNGTQDLTLITSHAASTISFASFVGNTSALDTLTINSAGAIQGSGLTKAVKAATIDITAVSESGSGMKLDAADVKVNITQNYTKFDIIASNSLQLGGQNGASITGVVQNASNDAAVTKVGALLGGATGTFLINNCTINVGGGGVCPAPPTPPTPPPPEPPPLPPEPPMPVLPFVDKNLIDQTSPVRTKIEINDSVSQEQSQVRGRQIEKNKKLEQGSIQEEKLIEK